MDSTGDNICAENANWDFGGNTTKHFDKHVKKSVPFYSEDQELVVQMSDFFLSDGSVCYDLGSSTGTLLNAIAGRSNKDVSFIGVDIEPDMVRFASESNKNDNVQFVNDNIALMDFEKSDLIISFYTLQFIKPKLRQLVFEKIYSSLNWGGALILFEKVRAPDARFQDYMSSLYTEYKINQGYTCNEIISKSNSLKSILEPFSTDANYDYLRRAGFKDVMTISKHICFEGFLAIK
jgi:tRNA (cmo5U34)-methyltransferase